jgi:folate-binding protein YgfZ
MVPALSVAAYEAARHRAAFIDRSTRGRLLLSGNDRASYLQGLLTNDIGSLGSGQGCYAAYLTPQGRMIADLWVYELGDAMLLTMDGGVKDTVLARLDQLIFTEDVRIGDVTGTLAEIAILGPDAAKGLVSAVGVDIGVVEGLVEHGSVRFERQGETTIITRTTDAGEPGYDLYVERSRAERVLSALATAGTVPLDEETAEAIRIEAGVPRFHRDMDEETIPLEAGIESRAMSFTKGCYVGQEVIIRVLHRGHGRIVRKLVGLRFEGDVVPDAGTTVRVGDREAGRITSATLSPALGRPIALASLHRDFVEPATQVAVGAAKAVVTALPFV